MPIPLRQRLLSALAAAALCTAATAQNVGINVTGAAPNAAAVLDIDAATSVSTVVSRGLLIPRMTGAQRAAIPVTAADDALLVYQTDLGGTQDTTNARGLWYYDAPATTWRHLSAVRTGWRLRGNSVATNGDEFLGTFSNIPGNKNLVFRSVPPPANPAMQMGYAVVAYQQGFVGLGTAAPATERLEVEGAIHFATNSANTIPASPKEGTIRYGTLTGAAPSTTDHKWHWGSLDTTANIYWGRLENAENFITPPKPYAKDTLKCLGATGNTTVGQLSSPPVTNTASAPCNYYSPFATNSDPLQQPIFRVQYLYRNQELVDAGICFPATITAIAFFCLDQETMTGSPTTSGATSIECNVRGGAASGFLTGPGAYFGLNNTAPYMDNNIRTQVPVRGNFPLLTPGPGWVNFALTTPITLIAGDNLIIDIDWLRSKGVGVGPRVELMNPGYACTKWVSRATGILNMVDAELLQDNPLTPGATVNPIGTPPISLNPHSLRPVTRFTGTIKSPGIVAASANYLQYDGGVMIGSPAWANAATTYSGPGTVKAEKGVYDGSLLLSDHVFDRYFDGAPAPQDAQASQGYAYVGLPQLREALARDRHLPNMPSRQEWEAAGGASLGRIATGLWESLEDQSLYITQLEQDLSALEELSFGKSLQPAEAEKLIAGISASKRLSEAQKLHLVEAIHAKTQPQAK